MVTEMLLNSDIFLKNYSNDFTLSKGNKCKNSNHFIWTKFQ